MRRSRWYREQNTDYLQEKHDRLQRDQKDTIRALGLRRLNQSVVKPDTPSVRGMVNKVTHMVVVEELTDEEANETA